MAHRELGETFHQALTSGNWAALCSSPHPDVTWTLPGDNTISAEARGADAVLDRVALIASHGVDFELLHILESRDNFALSLHNTARRGEVVLDEYLSTVCRVGDGLVRSIETSLSDVPGMNAFFTPLG